METTGRMMNVENNKQVDGQGDHEGLDPVGTTLAYGRLPRKHDQTRTTPRLSLLVVSRRPW